LVLQPFQPVDLVVTSLHLFYRERAPAVLLRVRWTALRLPVLVLAVALLELREVGGRERPVLLSDAGHIRARVVYPHRLRRMPFAEEDHVRLRAGAVRAERPVRQPQDS